MLLPANVDDELKRLGPWQDVDKVERTKEFILGDPWVPLHDLQMHQTDLSDGAAKREPA